MAKISLALSGSGFKFPAHVGALRAVLDSDHELVEVAGTSGGAIVAAMWACDMHIHKMEDIALETDWRPYIKLQLKALTRGGMNTGENIRKFCRELTEDRTFKIMPKHVSIISTDLTTNRPYLFNKEDTPDALLADAVRASISIPVMFAPFRYGDKLLVDGVVSNSLPMNHLFTEDSIRVGVKLSHTGQEFPAITADSGPIAIAKRSLFHLVDKQDDWAIDSGYFGNVIKVNTDYARGLDPNHARGIRVKLIMDGYENMMDYLETLE